MTESPNRPSPVAKPGLAFDLVRHPWPMTYAQPLKTVGFEHDELWAPTEEDRAQGLEGQCTAVLATEPSAQTLRWTRELLRALHADRRVMRDAPPSRYSPLTGNELKSFARGRDSSELLEVIDPDDLRDHALAVRSRWFAAFLLDECAAHALGYCTFSVQWKARDNTNELDLAVEPGEVWIAPGRRDEALSRLLVDAVADAAYRSAVGLGEQVAVLTEERLPVALSVEADIYSVSGERFLENCADALKDTFEWLRYPGLRIRELSVKARW